jgi:hypothetical protein
MAFANFPEMADGERVVIVQEIVKIVHILNFVKTQAGMTIF